MLMPSSRSSWFPSLSDALLSLSSTFSKNLWLPCRPMASTVINGRMDGLEVLDDLLGDHDDPSPNIYV